MRVGLFSCAWRDCWVFKLRLLLFLRLFGVNLLSRPYFFRSCVLAVSVAASAAAAFNSSLLNNIEKRYGVAARDRVVAWRDLMDDMSASEQSDLVNIARANDFFNQLQWVSDQNHWGVEDYWATPIEMLATDAGDCEDFSIGKYFTLQRTNMDTDKIRITYVKALDYNQAHMVLAYYSTPDAEPLILDNINKTILPASKRKDLVPIYSFNAENLWLARSRGRKIPIDPKKTLPLWSDVNARMLVEMGG